VLHLLPGGRRDLVVVDHDRAGVGLQPTHALLDDAVGFAHLGDAHQVAVVAVAIGAHRDIEIDFRVLGVRLHLSQVPGDAGTTDHGSGHAPGLGHFRADHADSDRALLPDAVVRQQRLVLVDATGEVV